MACNSIVTLMVVQLCFENYRPEYDSFIEKQLGVACEELQYRMDSFASYHKTGLPQVFTGTDFDEKVFAAQIHNLPTQTLGSLLYSMWRQVTHWEEGPFAKYASFFNVLLQEITGREG